MEGQTTVIERFTVWHLHLLQQYDNAHSYPSFNVHLCASTIAVAKPAASESRLVAGSYD